MTEIAISEDATLTIAFDTLQPVGAADIGLLLRDLSADYKRLTGGRLVLWRYETGSSWVYLSDAIAVAGSLAGSFVDISTAVQNMTQFVQHLIAYYDPKTKWTLDSPK